MIIGGHNRGRSEIIADRLGTYCNYSIKAWKHFEWLTHPGIEIHTVIRFISMYLILPFAKYSGLCRVISKQYVR
jgi:hypothetical protein